ncbi:MAG: thymidine phosphorylase [Eubacteriales bacterium]|jgi:pyrimidine-nucleoside phosphorylase|nr:thymidine phosphorylase [Bacillota bacterium]MBV1727605.1 thymidine phosphorylase [Desulforudis sp.]MDP3050405.1 thymidine phosphorylase [Eubacteriales bacterium]MDQ7789541.1 thymidine phosphorylase [Clostridia bacterium]MBU4532850.1 thymidine phosphorylase [Bacillota bacterium]
MQPAFLIKKKRDGGELTTAEIVYLINGYTGGEIPDYQVSAWLMAVFFRGMSRRETADLTRAMVLSGERCDLSEIPGVKVDKHSTGGVGDKTTLVLVPLVAAAGVPVAKMSGRGLGHTGGTIDKLESIPGFRCALTIEEMKRQVRTIGLAVVSQTGNLTPADKLLYSLRDVTATVDCIPLIAASVMSKKIASGADAVLLDVKTGSGAFMKEPKDALLLARTMVEIGTDNRVRTTALVTSMDEPLGFGIGNALEVAEAVTALRDPRAVPDLVELCLVLGSWMLVLGERAPDAASARQILEQILESGQALAKLREWISAQGGDPGFIDREDQSGNVTQIPVRAPRDGYVTRIDTENVGRAALVLGAGRVRKEDPIDPHVGLSIHKKQGDLVRAGEELGRVYTAGRGTDEAVRLLLEAYHFEAEPVDRQPLVHYRVASDGSVFVEQGA